MKLDDVNCASVVHTCLLLNAPTLLILIVGVLIVTSYDATVFCCKAIFYVLLKYLMH